MKLSFLVVWVAAGCGTISNDPPPLMPGPAGERDVIADGEWRWRYEETGADGVQRIEDERWHLQTSGDSVNGYYDRGVTFRSTTGVPFECNDSTEYTLRARYTVEGGFDGADVVLVELSHETVASPCERGDRALTTYRGHLDGNSLKLTWDTGTQTLERIGPPQPPAALPSPKPRVDGAWSWSAANQTEAWDLSVTENIVTGSYERSVARDGCTLTWRFTVRGTQDGASFSIAETEAKLVPGDCTTDAPAQALDSARGTSYGDVLVLEWRGGKRQVLHRPDPRN